MKLPSVTIKNLLEAGVHLGHKTFRWNPKMDKFIFGSKKSIHIIDLVQTLELINIALLKIHETISPALCGLSALDQKSIEAELKGSIKSAFKKSRKSSKKLRAIFSPRKALLALGKDGISTIKGFSEENTKNACGGLYSQSILISLICV